MAWDRGHPGHGDDHPERLLCAAVRRAIVPTVFLPVAVAFVGASATGTGIPLVVSLPLAALVGSTRYAIGSAASAGCRRHTSGRTETRVSVGEAVARLVRSRRLPGDP
jgi:hypothetical protein